MHDPTRPPKTHTQPQPFPLILNPTPLQTLLRPLRKTLRNHLLKLPKIRAIQHIRKAQIRIHNLRIQPKEVLPDSTQARILITERRQKHRRLAVIVELIVDTPLREYRALIQTQRSAELLRKSILQYEPRLQTLPVGERQELRGAGVDMWFVHPAWVHEASAHGDAEVYQRWEGRAVGEVALASETFAAAGVWVRGRVEVVFEPGVGGALGGEDRKTVFG